MVNIDTGLLYSVKTFYSVKTLDVRYKNAKESILIGIEMQKIYTEICFISNEI